MSAGGFDPRVPTKTGPKLDGNDFSKGVTGPLGVPRRVVGACFEAYFWALVTPFAGAETLPSELWGTKRG